MAYNEFVEWLNNLDLSTVDANPISFKLVDFESNDDFSKSMFLAGRYLSPQEDIVVRYSKPYNEDKTNVIVQFQILRSKSKIFFNYFKKNENEKICCFLTTNKEFKEFVKFFNSLAVKDEDRNNIKELDYASAFKESIEYSKKVFGEDKEFYTFVSIELKRDEEDNEWLAMSYAPILKENMSIYEKNCHYIYGAFSQIKEYVKKEILKIEE